MSPTSVRLPNTVTQRPSVITEQKPVGSVVNCHSGHVPQTQTENASAQLQDNNVQHPVQETGTTEQLRQHRRPARGKFNAGILMRFFIFNGGGFFSYHNRYLKVCRSNTILLLYIFGDGAAIWYFIHKVIM